MQGASVDTLHILGIVGSLRHQSYNLSAMRAVESMTPPDITLERFTLAGIPPFNQDDEQHPPPAVVQLKAKIRAADALLIATPEYNYSIPGVLKNAIDWATRPYGDNPFTGKPAAIFGASTGKMGTSRSQYHLRQVLTALNVHALNQPEVMIREAATRFDENGRLIDDEVREHLEKLLGALAQWTRQLRSR
jgi:chromate reductase